MIRIDTLRQFDSLAVSTKQILKGFFFSGVFFFFSIRIFGKIYMQRRDNTNGGLEHIGVVRYGLTLD